MITLITGAPGAGKSAALVSLLSEMAQGRVIYSSGIPDLALPHVELADVSTWPDVVPDGSCVVIDEVQRVWRPRGPGSKVPPEVAALETHRHRGLDFYVVSQAASLMDANVRRLVGRHVHLRDIGFLGRWWYEWPECCDNAASSWKNAPIKKRYRIDKTVFDKYKSASVHIAPVRSFPRAVLLLAVLIPIILGLGFYAYRSVSSKMNPSKTAPPVSSAGVAGAAGRSGGSYDASAFVPRVASKPESAPAYDGLRVVTAMPKVVGGFCSGSVCKCVTQQGSDPGIGDAACRDFVERPPFDPYRVAPAAALPAASMPETAPVARPLASLTSS